MLEALGYDPTTVYNASLGRYVSVPFKSFVSSVPESSTWAMMALGFSGLGLARFSASRKRGVNLAGPM